MKSLGLILLERDIKESGCNISDYAKRLGLSRKTIYNLLSGHMPSIGVQHILNERLCLNNDWL